MEFRSGDIFKSDAQTLVNTVNCRGVMGKGLALEFKKRFPQMFEEYKKECNAGRLRIGTLHLYRGQQKWVLNFPTKDHWRGRSKIEYIEAGLRYFVEHYKEWGIKSIAFPKLGCNLGGLDWQEVKRKMIEYLGKLEDLEIYIYEDVENHVELSLFPERVGK